MFDFLKKKKPEKKEINKEAFKGIVVFVYYINDMYKWYFDSSISEISPEIKIYYFKDLEQMIIKFNELRPQFIVTTLFGLKGLSAFNREEVSKIVKRIKSASGNATLIGIDGMLYPEIYLGGGFDYFIHLMKTRKHFEMIMYKIIMNQSLNEEEKSLVYEKKEFYDYVAKNGFFEKRSKKTADISKELRFLVKYVHGKILDAGCGDGRLAIPLAQLNHEVIGADLSIELINSANKKKGNMKYPVFVHANLLHTPFRNGEFDTVIMMWHIICELRKYRFDLIKEMSRIIKPNGRLIFDVPNTSKNIKINENGIYENKVDAFAKYVGLVPDLEELLSFLHGCGFTSIYYEQVKWNVPKFVLVADKKSFFT